MADLDRFDWAWLAGASALCAVGIAAFGAFHAPGTKAGAEGARRAVVRGLASMPVLAAEWVLVGAALVFGPSREGLFGGSPPGLASGLWDAAHAPAAIAGGARMVLAATLPALVASSATKTMKASAHLAFAVLWSTLVYAPLAHWMWGGGWLARVGAVDYAGGGVVHVAAGVSAVVLAAVLGARDDRGPGVDRGRPYRAAPSIAAGGVLWVGGLVANAAAAGSSPKQAALAFMATQLAAAGGALGWLLVEWRDRGRAHARGVVWGAASGLVAVTAGAGYVGPTSAVAIGAIAGATAYGSPFGVAGGGIAALLAITAEAGYVGPTVAVAVGAVAAAVAWAAVALNEALGPRCPARLHVVGGAVGLLLTGIFAEKSLGGAPVDGALFGNPGQLAAQWLAAIVCAAYAGAVTFAIVHLLDATLGLRAGRGALAPAEAPAEEERPPGRLEVR